MTSSRNCRITSWVLRIFHDALASDWNKELFIDQDILNGIALWLTSQFRSDRRRWEETSDQYYDRNMWVGTKSENIVKKLLNTFRVTVFSLFIFQNSRTASMKMGSVLNGIFQ